jgi:hypothetical protein
VNRIYLLLISAMLLACKGERRLIVTDTVSGPWEHPASLQDGADGPLQCTAIALKPVTRSTTTNGAIQNVLGVQAGGAVVLAGHGTTGSLCTGPRISPFPCPTIAFWNEATGNYAWGKPVDDLKAKGPALIRLLGCNVGSEEEGLKLLKALATRAQCTVAAPTGLVHCEDGVASLIDGAKWRLADKDGNVGTDTTPKFTFDAASSLKLYLDGADKTLPWREPIVHVEFVRSLVAFDSDKFETFGPEESDRLARMVDFSHPFHIGGSLLAINTGVVSLRLAVDGHEKAKQFLIYNDTVVQDASNTHSYYHADSRLTAWLVMRRAAHTPSR